MNWSVFLGYSFVSILAVEAATEFFLARLVERFTIKGVAILAPFSWLMVYVSAGVGIYLAFHFQLNAAHALAGLGSPTDAIGILITGAILGRGANGLNAILDWVTDAINIYILQKAGE